nr:hypothetical protein [Actinomycetota bacterium]
ELIEAEIAPNTPASGKKVGDLGLSTYGALIGGVVRRGEILHAHGDTPLQAGDRVIVFTPTAAEADVRRLLFG